MNEKLSVEQFINDCYEKYYQSIFKYCRVRLGEFSEHAEDCVQDAFVVLQRKLNEGETVEQPRAFLYRTADNFVKRTVEHYSKERKRTVELTEAENAPAPPIISDDFDYDEFARILIATLSEQEQELYILKYVQQKSLKEIAEILNIQPTAVAKRVSRLRQRIKDLIYEQNFFE
ncbi:MAG: sigma-70 family RNA polymerase sigma factor [Clostridia bacterium]|nr:sigma-70 family RNA polymerase sigma factor [Clostridia bacterium]